MRNGASPQPLVKMVVAVVAKLEVALALVQVKTVVTSRKTSFPVQKMARQSVVVENQSVVAVNQLLAKLFPQKGTLEACNQ